MLRKANTLSTREYDSYDHKWYLSESLQKPGNQPTSKQPKHALHSRLPITSKLEFFCCLQKQTLSNILLLLSAPLLVFGYTYANYNQINPVQIVFCKFLVQTIVHISISLFRNNHYCTLSHNQLKTVIFRAIFAALHTLALITAQQYFPLTTILTINSSGIVFLYVATNFMNKGTLNSNKTKGVFFCIFGLFFTIASQTVCSLFFQTHLLESYIHYENLTISQKCLLCLLILIWVFASALSLLYGALKTQTSLNQSMQMHSIVGLFLFSIPYQSFQSGQEKGKFMRVTLVSGVILAISNYLFNCGLHLSKQKGKSSFLNQLTILLGYLVSVFCLNQGLNYFQVIGSALILTSTYFILMKP